MVSAESHVGPTVLRLSLNRPQYRPDSEQGQSCIGPTAGGWLSDDSVTFIGPTVVLVERHVGPIALQSQSDGEKGPAFKYQPDSEVLEIMISLIGRTAAWHLRSPSHQVLVVHNSENPLLLP